jgi:putative PIN family toxin of toxin-antitoxin system
LRVVLDVNVLVSALLSRAGAPRRLIALWLEGAFELVVSEELLAELGRAVAYRKLREHISSEDAADFIAILRATASMLADAEHPDHISRDPGDDYLLALAKASASVLVSGDPDLLVLAPDLPIQSPGAFLGQLQR